MQSSYMNIYAIHIQFIQLHIVRIITLALYNNLQKCSPPILPSQLHAEINTIIYLSLIRVGIIACTSLYLKGKRNSKE